MNRFLHLQRILVQFHNKLKLIKREFGEKFNLLRHFDCAQCDI